MKSIFATKTFWGSVISLVAMFLPHAFSALGITQDVAAQYLVGAVGFGLTVYGRFKASQQVSVTGK
jgi:hypothetical protein